MEIKENVLVCQSLMVTILDWFMGKLLCTTGNPCKIIVECQCHCLVKRAINCVFFFNVRQIIVIE